MSSSLSTNVYEKKSSTTKYDNDQNTNTNYTKSKKEMYLYEMPNTERQNICAILDELNIWEDLAVKYMGYEKINLRDIKKALQIGNSPSGELLTLWGKNHTVNELYYLLYLMKQSRAMESIKTFVDPVFQKFQSEIQATESVSSSLLQPDFKQLLPDSKDDQKSHGITENDRSTSAMSSSMNTTDSDNDLAHNDIFQIARSVPEISYSELELATKNWSEEHVLGKGGFGTVYHGMWKYSTVAVKRIHGKIGLKYKDDVQVRFQQSLNELKYLNSCRHDNILPLYGYSVNGAEPCLVYQFMAGGSLEQRLTTINSLRLLSWEQRMNIAQGITKGLLFLHTFQTKPLIHADIKSANILLDPCCQPKIGDFGLAREGPNSLNELMEVSKVFGTRPYLPEEFLRSKSLSTKVDVYSFGIVLFELITALRPFEPKRKHKLLRDHILASLNENCTIRSFMDAKIPYSEFGEKISEIILELGKHCVSKEPNSRPEMLTVMEYLKPFQVYWDNVSQRFLHPF